MPTSTGNDPQRDGIASCPDAHALALLHHPDMLPPGGMAKGLDDLEDDRIAQRGIRRVKSALDHHPLSEIPGCEFAIDLKMAHTDIGEQPDRRIYMSQVLLRLRDLSLVRRDPPVDLGALVLHTHLGCACSSQRERMLLSAVKKANG